MNGMTRREMMLAASGVVAAAAGLRARPAPQRDIIDAHVHVWTSDVERYPLAPGFTRENLWFPSYTIEELLKVSEPLGVRRINLVQMTWYGLDHSYILDIIARDPKRFVGTGVIPGVVDVALPPADQTMVALSKRGVYAFRVRTKLTRPPVGDGTQWLDHPGYEKMFAAGAKHNLALSFLMGPADLPEIDRMCARFPDTPVILDHLASIAGKGSPPENEIQNFCRMARHKRVMVKIGAFYALGQRKPPYLDMLPLVRRVVEAFGPERCMWESDSPMQDKPPHRYEDSLALIRDHADFLTDSDKEHILVRTAERFFFQR
jgi:predicted TIM-barrel fold metal-dependent hydrolase